MISLEGKATHPGVAIAIAAVVDAKLGINSVSPALLQEGIACLRRGLPPEDYPEAIVVGQDATIAAATKIPGISTVGIAAESEAESAIAADVPCVVGVAGLIRSISDGDLIVVDGYRGIVHIDPDPPTLVHYQQAEEQRNLREKVFIASEHIPARTADGDTVYVYAHLNAGSDIAAAMADGADGLLVDLRAYSINQYVLCQDVLREAAGKPVVFLVDLECEEILRAAMVYCTPGQVTLAAVDADLLVSQVEHALDRIVLEALQLDLEPPQVNLGRIANSIEAAEGSEPIVIDAAAMPDETPRGYAERTIVIADEIDQIEPLVRKGVRRLAVPSSIVAQAKFAIRSIGVEG